MRSAPSRGLLLLALAAAGALLAPRGAHASYEEFHSVQVGRSEEDDESLFDHVLVRLPAGWEAERHGAMGSFRSSQGCLTAGRWFTDNRFDLRAPMGDTTKLDLQLLQVDDDESAYQWTRIDVRFPLPWVGLAGLRYQPNFEKSRQDAGVLWDLGHDGSPLQVKAVFGVEDVFNNFWASRQSQVDKKSQPYERHPYEPELRLWWRGRGPRVALGGKWLTPSVKRFDDLDPTQRRKERLWGVKSDAWLTQDLGRGRFEAGFDLLQASQWAEWETVPGDHHTYNRRWRVEGAWTHPYGEHARVTARFVYQERLQTWSPPLADGRLEAIDRMPMVETSFRMPLGIGARTGYMHDRVTVDQTHPFLPYSSWGTRRENRLFLSLQRRFGNVLVQGTEGIELDAEGYDVAFVHDKGFIHFQVAF